MDQPSPYDGDLPLPVDKPFTRSMARAAGVNDQLLQRLYQRGMLRRPVRNVYVGAGVPDSIQLRLAVLSLVVPQGCFVADHSAAWLHAGDVALPPNGHLEVPRLSVFRPADEGRLRNDLTRSGERTVRDDDLTELDGLLVTTPLRTSWDLGRLQQPDLALAGMDQMLALGVFEHEELVAGLPRFARQRGVVQLRGLVPLVDGRAQSFGESGLRRRWHDAGLPRPELQIPVMVDGRVLYWLDMGLEEERFAAEYDGERWHSDERDRQYDAGRRGWLREERAWWIEVFRNENVYGQRQDATERLATAHRELRSRRRVVDVGNSRRLG